MNSSDSGEDFESADEDFDNTSVSTTSRSEHKSNTGTTATVELSSSKDSDKHSLDLKQQENLTAVKAVKGESKNTQEIVTGDNRNTEKKADEVKLRVSKKLGTRLPTTRKSDGKSEKEIKDFTKEQTRQTTVISETEKDVNSEFNKLLITSTSKTTELKKEVNVLNVDECTPGDGWDVEDGLDIPETLEEVSDKSSQNVCVVDQDKQPSNEHQESQGWGGWGNWGVSSLLSTATGSVSSFSSQVTAGLSTVLETTVGAPDPETLAAASVHQQVTMENKEESTCEEDKAPSGYSGFGSLVSGVSFLGSTVINRGLDTLETLGKKTMEVLQEGDPGLVKKRAMLFPNQDKPVLSQILREAKEKADHSDKQKEEKEIARKAHFESLFDDFHGMVHLEALEMLSKQCELKLQSQLQFLSGNQLTDLQETLSQVRDLCELPEEDDDIPDLSQEQFAEVITRCVDGLKIKMSAAKIINVNNEVIARLSRLTTEPAMGVNQAAISSLAEFAAAAMECFHKSAELLLAKSLHNTSDEAENYIQLTSHLCARASAIANEFTQLLTKIDPIANSSVITNIFLEASNSCSYIRNACQLLVPILQVGAVSS